MIYSRYPLNNQFYNVFDSPRSIVSDNYDPQDLQEEVDEEMLEKLTQSGELSETVISTPTQQEYHQ